MPCYNCRPKEIQISIRLQVPVWTELLPCWRRRTSRWASPTRTPRPDTWFQPEISRYLFKVLTTVGRGVRFSCLTLVRILASNEKSFLHLLAQARWNQLIPFALSDNIQPYYLTELAERATRLDILSGRMSKLSSNIAGWNTSLACLEDFLSNYNSWSASLKLI